MERARRKETLAGLNMNKEENNEESHSSRVSAETQLPSQELQGDVLDIISPSGAAPLSGA
jgi:hypothetical protein